MFRNEVPAAKTRCRGDFRSCDFRMSIKRGLGELTRPDPQRLELVIRRQVRPVLTGIIERCPGIRLLLRLALPRLGLERGFMVSRAIGLHSRFRRSLDGIIRWDGLVLGAGHSGLGGRCRWVVGQVLMGIGMVKVGGCGE